MEAPTLKEVKAAVFDLDIDSTSGPGGFLGEFFQNYWDITGEDVVLVVLFYRSELPRYVTHRNLMLIPKKE